MKIEKSPPAQTPEAPKAEKVPDTLTHGVRKTDAVFSKKGKFGADRAHFSTTTPPIAGKVTKAIKH